MMTKIMFPLRLRSTEFSALKFKEELGDTSEADSRPASSASRPSLIIHRITPAPGMKLLLRQRRRMAR